MQVGSDILLHVNDSQGGTALEELQLVTAILDGLAEEVTFVDLDHVIRYMNKAARNHYTKYGDVVGHSVFECHNEDSAARIKGIFRQLQDGQDEVLYSENPDRKIYMRAVRDSTGTMIGYYERYAFP